MRTMQQQQQAPQKVQLEVGVNASEDFDVRVQNTSRKVAGEVVQVGLTIFSDKAMPDRVHEILNDPTVRN